MRIVLLFSRDLKLNILFNHAEHSKKLTPFVICTTSFNNSKISTFNGSASPFKKMTSVQGRGCPLQKSQAFEAPTDRFKNREHKKPLGLNKLRPSEALTRPEASDRSSQAPSLPEAPDIAGYMQKNMDHLFQTFLQASKGGSGYKF